MKETFISFYLRTYQIHVFMSALYGIGCPHRICFMLSSDGKSLLLKPYGKRDLKSHYIPHQVYQGKKNCCINSCKLCRILADLFHWDMNRSYRIRGWIDPRKQIAVFDLGAASLIEQEQTLE